MKFSMSEAWRDATAMMSANRELILIVAGLFFLLPSLAIGLTLPGLQETMMADPENAQAIVLEVYSQWWWLFLLVVLAQVVGYLGLLALLRDASRPTVGEALKAGLAGLLPAIGFYVLCGIGAVLIAVVVLTLMAASPALGVIAALLCVVAAIYVMIKLSLGLAVIVIDKVSNPITAVKRSWQLTKGNSFRLFLFFLLLVIVYIVISMVVGMILGVVMVAFGTETGLIVNAVLSGLLGAVLTVVIVAVVAAIHRQLSGPAAPEAGEPVEPRETPG